MLLAAAWLKRSAPGDAACAEEAARDAFGLATSEQQRAAALADEAKALIAQGKTDGARAPLRDALRRDPWNHFAFERLAMLLLKAEKIDGLLALTDKLMAAGIDHAQLLALRAVALGRAGDHLAARELLGLDRFLRQEVIPPPAGWDSLAAFNAALAAELTADPAIRFGRHGTASVSSWRIDSLAAGGRPLAQLINKSIAAAIEEHVSTLPRTGHPWIEARPCAALLRSWSVMTEDDGYERWHMHPAGWLSGVYYVQVPEPVTAGSGPAGCLSLGLSDTLAGAADGRAVGEHLVRPAPGLLTLFPSHCYHRTYPHRAPGRRISVAFDLVADEG